MRLNKTLALITSFLLLSFATAPAGAATYTDATGTEITLDQPADRVVSLIPSVTEMVYFLGKGGKLVGRSSNCDFPPRVTELPAVGDMTSVDQERLLQLEPDLVLLARGNEKRLVKKLRGLGLKVYAFGEPSEVSGIGEQITRLAKLLGTDQRTEDSELTFRDDLNRLGERAESTVPGSPSVLVSYSGYQGQAWVAGENTFLNSALETAGFTNPAAGLGEGWFQLDREQLAEIDPDLILVPVADRGDREAVEQAKQSIREVPELEQSSAVQNGGLIAVEEDRLFRPTHRLVRALLRVQRLAARRMRDSGLDRPPASAQQPKDAA